MMAEPTTTEVEYRQIGYICRKPIAGKFRHWGWAVHWWSSDKRCVNCEPIYVQVRGASRMTESVTCQVVTKYRAYCECGWVSIERDSEAEARNEWSAHVEWMHGGDSEVTE